MKKDEKVFRVRETDDAYNTWIVADGNNCFDTDHYVCKDGKVVPNGISTEYTKFIYTSKAKAQAVLDLYLEKQIIQERTMAKIEPPNCKPTNPKDALGIKKAPLSTLPTGPMYEVALAMLEGARKYGRHNYRVIGVRASVYYDAAMGHLTAWWEGEDIDPASGIHHLGKAMACLAVVRDSMMVGNWTDDRPPRYPYPDQLLRNNPLVGEILNRLPECKEPYTEINTNGKKVDRTKPVSGGY